MRRFISSLVLVTIALLVSPAFADLYQAGAAEPFHLVSETAAPPPAGVINIGQMFGAFLQPYVDGAVNALILGVVGWGCLILKTKFGINVDEGRRAALETALKNQANSLIADGRVKLDGLTVNVDNAALADAATIIMTKAVPEAVNHFGLTPEAIEAKIRDAIPQVPVGAAIVAAAHVETAKAT